LSDDNVDATPAVDVVSCVAVPFEAASAAAVIADVSTLDRAFKAVTTLAALEELTRFDDPLIRPEVNWSVKELVASVNELAPLRIVPRLIMFVKSLRSIEPDDLKI